MIASATPTMAAVMNEGYAGLLPAHTAKAA
jgi:hypothetical protein